MRIPRGSTVLERPQPARLIPEPGFPAPEATGGSFSAPPQTYPAGPTEFGWLVGQLQGLPFGGTPNTWTQPQTFTVTDTGGGVDRDALRPATVHWQHFTTQPTVAGVGTAHYHEVNDASGGLVRIGKQVHEITTTTAGIVDSTFGVCVMSGGTEVEVARFRGAHGMAPLLDPNGSVAGNAPGALPGYVGGALTVRGQLQCQGMQAASGSVNRPVLATSATTGGAGATGLGWGIDVQLQDAAGTLADTAYLDCALTAATANAVTSEWRFSAALAGVVSQVASLNGNGSLALPSAPVATANFGLLNLGNGGFGGGAGGFSGNVNGGFLCINAATGSAARLIDCQAAGVAKFQVNSAGNLTFTGTLAHQGTAIGFFSAAPVAKYNVTGSKGGNAALTQLLAGLVAYGLITDSTT